MKAEEDRKKALTAELEGLANAERVSNVDDQQLKCELQERVADVKALLGRHTPRARQMLRKLLEGKSRSSRSSGTAGAATGSRDA